MIDSVYETLGVNDLDHTAAAMFDTVEFVAAVSREFERLDESDHGLTFIAIPDGDGDSVAVSLYQWTGKTSARIDIAGPFDSLEATRAALIPFVLDRNLMLYDSHAKAVHNNRRKYPPLRV